MEDFDWSFVSDFNFISSSGNIYMINCMTLGKIVILIIFVLFDDMKLKTSCIE